VFNEKVKISMENFENLMKARSEIVPAEPSLFKK
jgi:hypothetical protein